VIAKLIPNFSCHVGTTPSQYSSQYRIVIDHSEPKISVYVFGYDIDVEGCRLLAFSACVQRRKHFGTTQAFPVVIHSVEDVG